MSNTITYLLGGNWLDLPSLTAGPCSACRTLCVNGSQTHPSCVQQVYHIRLLLEQLVPTVLERLMNRYCTSWKVEYVLSPGRHEGICMLIPSFHSRIRSLITGRKNRWSSSGVCSFGPGSTDVRSRFETQCLEHSVRKTTGENVEHT